MLAQNLGSGPHAPLDKIDLENIQIKLYAKQDSKYVGEYNLISLHLKVSQ